MQSHSTSCSKWYIYIIYIPPPHSASCLGASAVFELVGEWKRTTSASCRGWYHHVCKWTICASGWMKKHHEHKLQLVTTTTCASGIFAPVERIRSWNAWVKMCVLILSICGCIVLTCCHVLTCEWRQQAVQIGMAAPWAFEVEILGLLNVGRQTNTSYTEKYSVQNGRDCCHPTTDFNFLLLW